MVATPEFSVALPSEVAPLRNLTVPVAVEGVTVAVSVTLLPTTAEGGATLSAIVSAVVPVVPEGACQKSPQPVPNPIRSGAARSVRRMRVFPLRVALGFTLDPFNVATSWLI